MASTARFARELWMRTYEILQGGYLCWNLSQTTKSCLVLWSCFAKGKTVSERRWEVSWPIIQIGVFSKKLTLSYKVIWWLNLDIVVLKCGSNIWDNNWLTLYCDCVAECPHEYKKHRLRTRILRCSRAQWFLRRWNTVFLLHNFSASPNISNESRQCVCVCERMREREEERRVL